ncbi:hypothetical protein M5C99_22340 [Acidovorax sp. NCPPB 2350]|nr:hypothetical protein M5C99_22340 [Acidovorax sp. NCPPB 2350]
MTLKTIFTRSPREAHPPPAGSVQAPGPSPGTQGPERPVLNPPAGLEQRSPPEGGAASLYSTEHIAPRAKAGLLSRLQNHWKSGKTTASANIGPLTVGSQTQHPVGRNNQVRAPRFEGDGRVPMPGTTRSHLALAVQQALAAMQSGDALPDEPPGAGGIADQAQYWAQQALSLLAIGKGPSSVPADALALFHSAQGRQASDSPPPHKAPLVLQHLASVAHAEKARAAIQLAAQVDLPDGERLETQEAVEQLAQARDQALHSARDAASAASRAALDGLVATVPQPLQARLRDAAQALADHLDAGHKLADVLAAQMLVDVARSTFPGDPEALVQAMETLRDITPADLIAHAQDVFGSPGQMQETGQLADPALRLACALARPQGGSRLLAKAVTNETTDAATQTALRVAMAAVVELQQAAQRTGGKVTPAQRDWLGAAVAHAAAQTAPSPTDAPDPAQARRQRIAFNGVHSGFMTDEPGSSYDRVRQRLGQFSDGALEQTAHRNERAAQSRWGRLQNWASGSLPKAVQSSVTGFEGLLAPALPVIASWLPGTQPTMWRKSVMRQLTQSASANGLLPDRQEAVMTLHRTARDIRQGLQARAAQGLAPAETLLRGVLEELDLGGARPPAPPQALKRLGLGFFEKVEARLGEGGAAGLPPSLAADWQALRGHHPNAGHLLRLLADHIDLRALLDGTQAPTTAPTQVARGQRGDALAHEAIDAFASVAQAVQATAAKEAPEEQALGDLLHATAAALAAVKPAAVLRSLRIETFEAIENQLTRTLLAGYPKSERPPWHLARQMVLESWPGAVQDAWHAMKAEGADAGRLLRALADAIPDTVRDRALPDAQAPNGVPTVEGAIAHAALALQALQRDVHVSRFELAMADTVTLFNDLRGPRDAAAVVESLVHRISLGEKIKSSDARQARLEVGKAVSLTSTAQELIAPIAGIGLARERSLDLNMVGAAMQMQIGTIDSHNASIGLSAGLRGALGETDHEFNLGDDEAGIALRFDLRFEASIEQSQTRGVSLRMRRTAGHEDTLRQQFTDALVTLTHARQTGGEAADPLALLLDRHPDLAIAELTAEKRGRASELGFGADATLRVRGPEHRDPDDRRATRRAVGIGVKAGAATANQRQHSVQTESRSGLNVEEYKLSAQHRADLRASAGASIMLVPSSQQDPSAVPRVRGVGGEIRHQIANSGVDTTLRITTRNGETWADQTQMIREFEDLDDFLEELEPRQHQFIATLAGRDNVPGATDAEKTGRAWQRLRDTLVQAAAASAPGMAFSVVTKLRPEAAQAYDTLRGLEQAALEDGRADDAEGYLAQIHVLLGSHDAWIANNLQFKSKSRDENAQSATLGILQGKASAESTRLHEFLPAGAQQVGRSLQQHNAAPADHSARWEPRPVAERHPLPEPPDGSQPPAPEFAAPSYPLPRPEDLLPPSRQPSLPESAHPKPPAQTRAPVQSGDRPAEPRREAHPLPLPPHARGSATAQVQPRPPASARPPVLSGNRTFGPGHEKHALPRPPHDPGGEAARRQPPPGR